MTEVHIIIECLGKYINDTKHYLYNNLNFPGVELLRWTDIIYGECHIQLSRAEDIDNSQLKFSLLYVVTQEPSIETASIILEPRTCVWYGEQRFRGDMGGHNSPCFGRPPHGLILKIVSKARNWVSSLICVQF